MNNTHEYNGLASIVNGKLTEDLQPGEFRYGDVRMFPKANEKGEAIVRLHVTNEVEMLIARNHYAWIKAWMWIAITALYLATFSGLLVHFQSH
jgi:hypothetical protein